MEIPEEIPEPMMTRSFPKGRGRQLIGDGARLPEVRCLGRVAVCGAARSDQVSEVACVEAGPRRTHAVTMRRGYPRWWREGGARHATRGVEREEARSEEEHEMVRMVSPSALTAAAAHGSWVSVLV
jgi:hypothetical protein